MGSDWVDWTDKEINTEFPLNSNFFDSDVQRHFLPGAAGHDSLQIRFIYNDNYYFWVIDDVKLVETECNNMRLTDHYAIPPWVQVPSNQIPEFAAFSRIHNAGACAQTNVNLNFRLVDTYTNAEVFNQDLSVGYIEPNSTADVFIPKLIHLPDYPANYKGIYTITTDSVDFNPANDSISFSINVGGHVFAHEDDFTRSISVNTALYDFGAHLSYAFGNIFHPKADAAVDHIIWGANNPEDMAGKTVLIYLIQWTDTNDDLIAQSSERQFIGYNEYRFTGNEVDNVIIESPMENFINPGSSVFVRKGFHYIAVVEYVASTPEDPQFFMLANDTRDFSAQIQAIDSAFAKGLTDSRLFMTALGFSPDGNISNIDYEVRELDVNDDRLHFGHNMVPLVRLILSHADTVHTKNDLPPNTLISIHPNPSSDIIVVRLEFLIPYVDVHLSLINSLGQSVYNKVLNGTIQSHNESINVREMIPGNYLLQVETKDGRRSISVVVIR